MSRPLAPTATHALGTWDGRSPRVGPPLLAFLLSGLLLLSAAPAGAQERYPGERWMRYATPEEAGWSSEGIERVKAFADSIGTAAFLLVHDGAVVAAHGDYARRYMCHSVRKSLLSGLIGVYVDEGAIEREATLAELGLDDRLGLTDVERTARVVDLLKARSGVYHPAAYETAGMAARRPERGSHEPGAHWYYNNWDFNALGAIFRQETGEDVFEAFGARIAEPVGMRDYRPVHGYYHLEPEHSRIPAYPFRMSARDLARFGLLFEREGRWRGEQVLPASWVEESTRPYSETDRGGEDGGYGYMWWTLGGELGEDGAYSAFGVGTQAVTVVPELDLVFVHRVDTYAGDRVGGDDVLALLRRLIEARRGAPVDDPQLVALEEPRAGADVVRLAGELLDRFVGSYRYPSGHTVEVRRDEDRLLVSSERIGTYGLVPLGRRQFLVEDARYPVFFVPTSDGGGVDLVAERLLLQEAGFLAGEDRPVEALAMLERAVEYYPASADARRAYGRALLARADTASAEAALRRALALERGHVGTEGALVAIGAEGFVPVELTPSTLERYVGEYRGGPATLPVSLREGRLYLATPASDGPEPLVAVSDSVFYRIHERGVMRLVFERDADGAITGLSVQSDGGGEIRLEKTR